VGGRGGNLKIHGLSFDVFQNLSRSTKRSRRRRGAWEDADRSQRGVGCTTRNFILILGRERLGCLRRFLRKGGETATVTVTGELKKGGAGHSV